MREARPSMPWLVASSTAAWALVGGLALASAPAAARDGTESAASAAAPADAASTPRPGVAASGAAPRTEASRIEATVRRLRADPLLSGTKKSHHLRFKDDDEDEPEHKAEDGSWRAWLRAFAAFMNDAGRLLVYGLAIVLAAVLVVSARRFVSLRDLRRRPGASASVSHVRDLDVRPDSLPDDIGAAAWALWQAGDAGAALSLLYRGALSRLIHRHACPIAASTTEGECIALARDRLAPDALRYLTRLVLAWQAAVYGRRALSPAMGEALCTGFAPHFDRAASAPTPEAAT